MYQPDHSHKTNNRLGGSPHDKYAQKEVNITSSKQGTRIGASAAKRISILRKSVYCGLSSSGVTVERCTKDQDQNEQQFSCQQQ